MWWCVCAAGLTGLIRSPEESYGDNATGLWCVIFTASKVLELLDTVFVVLRKKKVIFLHWYAPCRLLYMKGEWPACLPALGHSLTDRLADWLMLVGGGTAVAGTTTRRCCWCRGSGT